MNEVGTFVVPFFAPKISQKDITYDIICYSRMTITVIDIRTAARQM